MPDTNEIVDHLNRLIQVNKDTEAGFLGAAQNVQNSELDSLFTKYANEHSRFTAELQHEMRRIGGDFSDSGTLSGASHRGWMDFKANLSGHSAGSILAGCQAGEEWAENAYLDATDANPSGQTRAMLNQHLQQIQEFRTRLTRLVRETKDGVEFQTNE